MASLTRLIEQHIQELLKTTTEESVFLSRKDLSEHFGCVPSQINYVIRSRFTPERGYIVESQRGGHGYIRVIRLCLDMPEDRANHIDELIGDTVNEQETRRILANLQHRQLITTRERLLIEVATRFQEEIGSSLLDLSPYKRDSLHAGLLKRLLRSLVLG
ncbi:MAG: CtsR family transcriptional regulator [Thermovirgaceae bacterium]|nr:CtsR family transcriptional regulator [Thermovirgaceae bacterium]